VKFIRFELTIVGLLVVAAAGLPGVLNAQSAPGDAEKFEVASIRPSRPDVNPPAIRFMPGGGLEATGVTLKLLIQIAYDIRPEQLSGGSRWADSEQYDIYAKGPEGRFPAASDADGQRITRMCIRALLAERFKLNIQRRSKDASGYALIAAKNGPELTRSNGPGGRLWQTGITRVTGEGATIESLAKFLGVRLGQDVIDRTGLKDRYDFTLFWAPEARTSSPDQPGQVTVLADPVDAPGPSIFAALQAQLGLKLEPQKNPSDFLTIEHAEKPTEN
jgi:uncharacterized protein (TIGR03435 family)